MGAPVDGVFDHSGMDSKYSNDSIHVPAGSVRNAIFYVAGFRCLESPERIGRTTEAMMLVKAFWNESNISFDGSHHTTMNLSSDTS
jgi:hypothetical protein